MTLPSLVLKGPQDLLLHLTCSGVSLVLDLSEGRLPAVIHWGAALGGQDAEDIRALRTAGHEPAVPGGVDQPVRVSMIPEAHTGFVGRPGIAGHRNGTDWSPKFEVSAVVVSVPGVPPVSPERGVLSTGPAQVVITARDDVAALELTVEIELLPSGLIRARSALRNDGASPYTVDELNVALPVPARAVQLLDFAGRWSKERVPQRVDFVAGLHQRDNRRGRTGADAATVLSAGVAGFGFARGEVWGVHVAFSGNHRHYAERLSTGLNLVGGGELLLPGEVRLEPSESYRGPWLYASYGDGLDEQAARFHRYLRSRPAHPRTPRPVTFNAWEAVYFEHDLDRLLALAEQAEQLGIERFVLDDGWFQGRRDDTAGLGDWYVDETVWPDGLHPLTDAVTGRGMQFGLWVEPEMVNLDSDLAREHPDWLMATGERMPVPARHQQVLNLTHPDAYAHILGRLTALLAEYPIGYLKWDHNRDLVDAGRSPSGAAAVHDQTLAVYRLMAEIRRQFPGVEIESCSSGGARVDLEIIEHTDRVWVSDCIDPHERQQMNRWTMQLLPAELLGSHVASAVSHTTGRAHRLSFRAATALYGHFGVEWDLLAAGADDLSALKDWISLYKGRRELLHTGTLVRMDTAEGEPWIYGCVAEDQSSALFFLAFLERSAVAPGGRFILRGLDPDTHYRVSPLRLGAADDGVEAPGWFEGVVLTGRALAVAGLHLPTAFPDTVILVDVTATDPVDSGAVG